MSDESLTVFNGRYELLRRIARGGMADVYLARDADLGRQVAVKVLFPEFAHDPSFVERFRREAKAAANLVHPNIVSIFDWGQEQGTYYIVMEYVVGRSMADVLRSTGPLSTDRAAEIAHDVAVGLRNAHAAGLVHRDIKLGNIIVSDDGQVKVADFGIATALARGTGDNLTQFGSVMGTATYFSPEQAQGKSLDGRSDLYSLGVVLYEMIVGKPPFVADTPTAVAVKHVQERPVPPSARAVPIAESLEAIILKLLAKNPAKRYPKAEDLCSDLRRYLAGQHRIPPKPPESDLLRGGDAALGGLAALPMSAAAAAAEPSNPAAPLPGWPSSAAGQRPGPASSGPAGRGAGSAGPGAGRSPGTSGAAGRSAGGSGPGAGRSPGTSGRSAGSAGPPGWSSSAAGQRPGPASPGAAGRSAGSAGPPSSGPGGAGGSRPPGWSSSAAGQRPGPASPGAAGRSAGSAGPGRSPGVSGAAGRSAGSAGPPSSGPGGAGPPSGGPGISGPAGAPGGPGAAGAPGGPPGGGHYGPPPTYFYEEVHRSDGWKRTSLMLLGLAVLVGVLVVLAVNFYNRTLGFGGDDNDTVTPAADEQEAALVEVPDMVGFNVIDAQAELRAKGLTDEVEYEVNNEIDESTVFRQSPPAGQRINEGDVVLITVSRAEKSSVPAVRGRNSADARELLTNAGYTVIPLQEPSQAEAGIVVGQEPVAGTELTRGDAVTIRISTGPGQLFVPVVSGLSLVDAFKSLNDMGLRVDQRRESHPDVPEGEIINTEPPANSPVGRGELVVVIISEGPPRLMVPDVEGLLFDTGKLALERVGLVVGLVTFEPVEPDSTDVDRIIGRIIAQSPAANVEVEAKTEINLTVGSDAANEPEDTTPPPEDTTPAPEDTTPPSEDTTPQDDDQNAVPLEDEELPDQAGEGSTESQSQ